MDLIQGQPTQGAPQAFVLPPSQNQVTDDLARWQLSLDDIFETCEHNLRLDTWSEVTETWIPRAEDVPPIINQEGVRSLMMFLRMHITKTLLLSNYSREEKYAKLRFVANRLSSHLLFNWSRFGIPREERSIIKENIMTIIEDAMNAVEGGGLREHQRASISEHRIIQSSPQPQGGGAIFSIFRQGNKTR